MKLFVRDLGTRTVHYFIEQDSYALAGNESEVTDIEACHKYGDLLVGSVYGFMDWMCHRDFVKALIESVGGSDYSTYVAGLNAAEKKIASKYVPTKIVDALGYTQLASDAGGINEAKSAIKEYLALSVQARKIRYNELVSYAYQRLGKNQGLQLEDVIRENNLHEKFKERGVLKKANDSVDGFEDYFLSIEDFTGAGVLALLNDSTYELIDDGSGQSNQEFVDSCIAIIKNGQY